MRFSTCTAANQVRFWRVQSRHHQFAGQAAGQLRRHLGRLVQVFQLDPHAGRAFQPEDAGRIVHVHQHQAGVVLVVARVKGTDHRHLLEPGHHTGGRHLPAGRHQRDLVALAHPQGPGQLTAQHHAKFTRDQTVQAGVFQLDCQIRHLRLMGRVNAPHDRAFHVLTPCQQGLGCYKRCSTQHLRVGPHFGQRARQIRQGGAIGGEDFDMRHHAQHAVAHLFLKAVHHAQHDDQRRHTQGNAEHGNAGNKRDEAIAPGRATGPGVAPAKDEFVGELH